MSEPWPGSGEPVDPNGQPGGVPPYPGPPYQPPPPYGTPPYGTPPYGTPPYGTPPYSTPPTAGPGPYAPAPRAGWYDAAGQWQPAGPPPSHTRRTVLIVVATVVVLALAGGLTWAFAGGSSKPSRLTIPQSFDGYSRLTNDAANRMESSMRTLGDNSGSAAAKQLFDAASIGVYAKNSGDQPVLVSLVLRTSSAPDDKNPDDVTAQMLSGAVSDPVTYPSGSRGGVTKCGTVQFGTATETLCGWSDPSTSGLLVSVNPALAPRTLAGVSRTFRDQVD